MVLVLGVLVPRKEVFVLNLLLLFMVVVDIVDGAGAGAGGFGAVRGGNL